MPAIRLARTLLPGAMLLGAMLPGAAAGQATAPAGRPAMLQELAGTMGVVHALTVACEGRGTQYWRERMIALIEAEAPENGRVRTAMIEAFNDRYQDSQRAWTDCSAQARAARRAAAARGEALSAALAQAWR